MPKSTKTEYRMVKGSEVEVVTTAGQKVALEYQGWRHEVAEPVAKAVAKAADAK